MKTLNFKKLCALGLCSLSIACGSENLSNKESALPQLSQKQLIDASKVENRQEIKLKKEKINLASKQRLKFLKAKPACQKNRFKSLNGDQKFIYDSFLRGYWSQRSAGYVGKEEAKSHCGKLGPNWRLPNALEISSLLTDKAHKDEGFIHPAFTDNDRFHFWTQRDENLLVMDFKDGALIEDIGSGYDFRARCFKSE